MKQIIISIPDNKYLAFIEHIKTRFSEIQIDEKREVIKRKRNAEEDDFYDTLLLSEKSLEEDWLSKEDSRWDELL